MKLISNETWMKYQDFKARDWKQVEKIRKEELSMKNNFDEHCHRCMISFEMRIINANHKYDDEILIFKSTIKSQRDIITKQHIDIDKLQKLLKRKKK